MLARLPLSATPAERAARYDAVITTSLDLLGDDADWISAMATVACELHGGFAYFDWTGFYRAVSDSLLVVGPYQGKHGCLRVELSRGVCGAAARSRRTQRIADVTAVPDHIACSSTTRSEIVVPVLTPRHRLLGVLDVDSDAEAAFGEIDQASLERLCAELGRRYADTPIL